MPKTLKKRGRRAEKQRQNDEHTEEPPVKKRKIIEAGLSDDQFDVNGDAGDDFISFGQTEGENAETTSSLNTFYGLLTEDEQQYYTNVNSKLSANDFESEEDKRLFIDAVYRDLAGKEIKIASSQSCSRVLERIISLSNPQQLSSLFHAFLQDLSYLVQHRFGSHCCEALFLRAAKDVSPNNKHSSDNEDTIESYFLSATSQLKENVGYLLTERFASHTLRLLLLILSGQPLDDGNVRDIVASRRKEKIDIEERSPPTTLESRKVPDSFRNAGRELILSAIHTIDTTYLRALATHPTGNPVLQLLLKIEASDRDLRGHKTAGLLEKLIPDLEFNVDSESSKFVSSLVYDSTGAHLVQTLVKILPGKAFKRMYKNLFRDRIGKLAKNEIASYVAASIFERVGKDDLDHASNAIIEELSGLFERNRLAVVRHLVESCAKRSVDLNPLADSMKAICSKNDTGIVLTVLKDPTRLEGKEDESSAYNNLQGSLLVQTMLQTQQLANIIQDSLLSISDSKVKDLCENTVASRVIQVSLTAETSSAKFRRLLIPRLYGIVIDLAVHPSGSHVIDALWTATEGSHFMKERIAKILQQNESKLRDSLYGRAVWRNWDMDTLQRRPSEWHANAKGMKIGQSENKLDDAAKTPIQLARERYMQKASRKFQQTSTIGDTVAAPA